MLKVLRERCCGLEAVASAATLALLLTILFEATHDILARCGPVQRGTIKQVVQQKFFTTAQ